MEKRFKIILGSLIGVAGLTGYLLYRRTQQTKLYNNINDILDAKVKDPNAMAGGQTILPQSAYNALPDGVYPIKVGDPASKKVYDIQQMLNRNFGTTLDLDGKYGESTWQAMCKNIWNTSIFTTTATDCYDLDFNGLHKKYITQADYEKVKAGK